MLTRKLNSVKLRIETEVKELYEYKKLRGRIIEKFGTQERFSKEIGISETSLSKKMKCKTGISQADICLWSKLLDISPEEYGVYFFT